MVPVELSELSKRRASGLQCFQLLLDILGSRNAIADVVIGLKLRLGHESVMETMSEERETLRIALAKVE